MNYFIIKYSEISLKGKNRSYFEKTLVKNIKKHLKKPKIKKIFNRFVIETTDGRSLKNVFGIANICKATKTQLSIKEIEKQALKLASSLTPKKSFKISTIRANKNFPYNSLELNMVIGSTIVKKTHAKVKLHKPNLEIFIEILDEAYLYTKKIQGKSGLPVGSEGRVLALIENSASILAALLAMKRGCSIVPLYFKKANLQLLEKYNSGFKLKHIKIKNLSEIDKLAKDNHAKALILNQTLRNLKKLPIKTPILRPLISLTNPQIEKLLSSY